MLKRRKEGGDQTAVRARILEAAFAAFMKSGQRPARLRSRHALASVSGALHEGPSRDPTTLAVGCLHTFPRMDFARGSDGPF